MLVEFRVKKKGIKTRKVSEFKEKVEKRLFFPFKFSLLNALDLLLKFFYLEKNN